MTDECAEAGDQRMIVTPNSVEKQNRRGSLQGVANEGCGRKQGVPAPQHVGRTDVSRTDLANIRGAAQAGEDHPERDRAEQITDRQCCHIVGPGNRPANRVQHPEAPSVNLVANAPTAPADSQVLKHSASSDDRANHTALQSRLIERCVLALRF